jgi:hypothetical protein
MHRNFVTAWQQAVRIVLHQAGAVSNPYRSLRGSIPGGQGTCPQVGLLSNAGATVMQAQPGNSTTTADNSSASHIGADLAIDSPAPPVQSTLGLVRQWIDELAALEMRS